MKKRLLSILLSLSMLLCLAPFSAQAVEGVTVTKTDIEADSVLNYDGYASLTQSEEDGSVYYTLLDRTGKILQSYSVNTDDYIGFGTSGYAYSDGLVIINSADGSGYLFDEISSHVYNLDGSIAFEIASMEDQIRKEYAESDPDYVIESIERTCSIKPFRDGVSFVRDRYSVCGYSGWAGGCGYRNYSYLVNTRGEILYQFPEEFNDVTGGGLYEGFTGSCGWAGEGLVIVTYGNYEIIDDEYIYVGKAFGYMNYSGNMVLDFLNSGYTNLYPFVDGRAMVRNADGKYGYIDKTGKEIIPAQYDSANSFEDGLAAVCKDGKCGVIDTNGNIVIPFQYDSSYGTGDGYATFSLDGKFGLVDTNNRVILPLEYDDITPVSEGVAYAIQDGILYIIEIDIPENPFTDVPAGVYYYDPILWAYSNGITTGTTATTFEPEQECTRGQIVTFLWRAAGSPEPISANNPFVDVTEAHYFYKAVLWAVEQGITTGTTSTTFSPEDACTRAQVVTFMYRAAGKPTVGSTDNPFTDVPANQYFYDAVLWAVENGITTGVSATEFAPNDTCTRGQIVTFLYRGYAK